MVSSPTRRMFRVVLIALVVLAIVAATAVHMATRSLRNHIVTLLGPTGHAERIDVGFTRITLDRVVIKAPPGWPAADALRAERIVLTPDLWKLLSHRVSIHDAELDNAYMSILRTPDGKISLLPNLRAHSSGTDKANASDTSDTSDAANGVSVVASSGAAPASATSSTAASSQSMPVDLGAIVVHNGTLDFFDASVAQPPSRLQITQLQSSVGPLHFPTQNERTQLSIAGKIANATPHGSNNGPTANDAARSGGPLAINGWIVFGTQQSDIHTQFSNVDVRTLQPYLNKRKSLAIDSGLVSIDVHSTVENRELQANGKITLDQLQLARGDNTVSALESIPRDIAIAALKDKQNRITLDFSLQGNLSDPKFSLNENIATRLAAGLAKALGVSAEGVANSVGGTTKGLGGALMNLIGK